jgi:hypothetical protein
MSRTYHHSYQWGSRNFFKLSNKAGPTPGWWVTIFMNRPKRHHDARLLDAVCADKVDADEALYELGNHRPHIYYW